MYPFLMAAAAFVALILAAYVAVAWNNPWSMLCRGRFYWQYRRGPEGALLDYARLLGSRPVPGDVAAFLTGRLEAAPAERDAVVGFFAREVGRGAEVGDAIPGLGPTLVEAAVAHLPSCEDRVELRGTMILMEEARQGRALVRATLMAAEEEESPAMLVHAAACYQQWWSAPVAWEAKRATDPLEAAGMRWSEP